MLSSLPSNNDLQIGDLVVCRPNPERLKRFPAAKDNKIYIYIVTGIAGNEFGAFGEPLPKCFIVLSALQSREILASSIQGYTFDVVTAEKSKVS